MKKDNFLKLLITEFFLLLTGFCCFCCRLGSRRSKVVVHPLLLIRLDFFLCGGVEPGK